MRQQENINHISLLFASSLFSFTCMVYRTVIRKGSFILPHTHTYLRPVHFRDPGNKAHTFLPTFPPSQNVWQTNSLRKK